MERYANIPMKAMVFLSMTIKLETMKEKIYKINYIITEKFCMAKISGNKLRVNSFNSYDKGYK